MYESMVTKVMNNIVHTFTQIQSDDDDDDDDIIGPLPPTADVC